ncbi:hypothetical protein BDN67DRAFT_1017526 [Paxillus ammoniavirescens]|nr:hypothetical protein BDN67DRAFT_1017526 [Paxillus ammoniavirescens]
MASLHCSYSPAAHQASKPGRAAFAYLATTTESELSSAGLEIEKTVVTCTQIIALEKPLLLSLHDPITLYSLNTPLSYTGHLNCVAHIFKHWVDVEMTPCMLFNSLDFCPPPIYVRIQRKWITLPTHLVLRHSLANHFSFSNVGPLPVPAFCNHLITLTPPPQTPGPATATITAYPILSRSPCLLERKSHITIKPGRKCGEIEYNLTLPSIKE